MPLSILEKLYQKAYWSNVYHFFETRSYRQEKKLAYYQDIIINNLHTEIANQVLNGKYHFRIPLRLVVNKIQTGKKKTVYLFDFKDDFLLKVINRILTEEFSGLISPACHSFQKGKGAKTAFRSLIADNELDNKHFLKTDVHNFFNSVQVDDFIDGLPVEIKSDIILFNLIQSLLLNKEVKLPDGNIVSEQKGLMAGCPLSPFLSNIYLRDLDKYFTNNKITYTRYSDDIVIFDYQDKIDEHRKTIENYLSEKQLQLNESKTLTGKPGEVSVFLGFSYIKGKIDLSPVSVGKMKAKIKRLSRSYNRRLKRGKMDDKELLTHFIGRINRKLYGIDAKDNDLCWAHWFFPVINTSQSLEILDKYIQERLRYAVTGRNNKANYRKVPYQVLKGLGYIPLKAAYFTFIKDYKVYLKAIGRNDDL